MSITPGFDVTGANLGKQPAGQLAGYDTGSAGIAWSAAQFEANPGTVHIDQDVQASDYTADVLDVERGAATVADVPRWFTRALANYRGGVRPGQRYPAVYISKSRVTDLANALTVAGHTITPHLWVADWNGQEAADIAAINTASGPWPIVAFQFESMLDFDLDVFSTSWLQTVSRKPSPVPPQWVADVNSDLRAAVNALNAVQQTLAANVR